MARAKQLSVFLMIAGLAVVGFLGWSRSSAAAGPLAAGGDPALADMALLPGAVRGSGKYSFFMVERENSSHRWCMRFNSETGVLEKLTAEKGWAPVGSTQDMMR